MYRSFVLFVTVFLIAFPSATFAQQKKSQPSKEVPHNHPTKGPHHGELLELGNEEYHVEMVMNESKHQLDIYLLDAKGKSPVDIDAEFLALNMKIGGKPVQFKLKPVHQDKDRTGMASCFSLVSKEMLDGIHGANADARLSIKIAQKPYVLKLVHKHDHDHANHAKGSSTDKR